MKEGKYVDTLICMPRFSVVATFFLTKKYKQSSIKIYYDFLPRYLRALRRLCKILADRVINAISKVLKVQISPVKHGDQVPDYPNLHLNSMQLVSKIADHLDKKLENDPWIKLLGEMIGQEPARAFAIKYLGHNHLFPHLLAILACYYGLHKKKTTIVFDVLIPEEWCELIQKELSFIHMEIFQWPAWYRWVHDLYYKLILLLFSPIVTMRWILRRGIGKTANKSKYKILTEFIDPRRFNGTAYDADYLVGDGLTSSDILYYLTYRQRRTLKQHGFKKKFIKEFCTKKGYHFAMLDSIPYSWQFIKMLPSYWLATVRSIISGKAVTMKLYVDGFLEYLEFLPLFERFKAEYFLYLTFPNGQTGFRINDAIVTGLCRHHGITSVGCQTRSIYSTKYEYCFDCFDIYFAWGNAWHEAFLPRMKFIRNTHMVGCIYLDALLPYSYSKNRHRLEKEDELLVSIFPSDIEKRHHYTIGYSIRFLCSCAELAEKNPNIQFVVKMKEPTYVNLAFEDKNFSSLHERVKGNFVFLRQEKYTYSELLSRSNIVIAIGFTTPGTEALLMGKRAIYYSELYHGGQPFCQIPNLIASTPNELQILFSKALVDHRKYCESNSRQIDVLDPFRDGMTKLRIMNHLHL